MEDLLLLAVGILIHKFSAAVSMGGALTHSGYSERCFKIFVNLFALTTPIGIIIGASVNAGKIVESGLIFAILMSISGGTFIYVACSEIVINEFDEVRLQWAKVLIFFIGGTLINVPWFFVK